MIVYYQGEKYKITERHRLYCDGLAIRLGGKLVYTSYLRDENRNYCGQQVVAFIQENEEASKAKKLFIGSYSVPTTGKPFQFIENNVVKTGDVVLTCNMRRLSAVGSDGTEYFIPKNFKRGLPSSTYFVPAMHRPMIEATTYKRTAYNGDNTIDLYYGDQLVSAIWRKSVIRHPYLIFDNARANDEYVEYHDERYYWQDNNIRHEIKSRLNRKLYAPLCSVVDIEVRSRNNKPLYLSSKLCIKVKLRYGLSTATAVCDFKDGCITHLGQPVFLVNYDDTIKTIQSALG